MKTFIFLFSALLSGLCNAQEFDFRGATLGMSSSDFQALPPIDGKLFRNGSATTCKLSSNKPYASIGIVQCSRAGDDPFDRTYGLTSINYYFFPDAAGDVKLFMINISSRRENYLEALASLSNKWGKGITTETTAINGLGQTIPASKVLWKNTSSEIELESPCDTVRNLCLSYRQKDIEKSVGSKLAEEGKTSNKF